VNTVQISEATLLSIKGALTRNYDLLRAQDEKLHDHEIRQRQSENEIGLNRADIRQLIIAISNIKELREKVISLESRVAVSEALATETKERMTRIVTPLWAAIAVILVGVIWMLVVSTIPKFAKVVSLPDPPGQPANLLAYHSRN
jgi:hypothetical protein